jgi:hypothetical protein
VRCINDESGVLAMYEFHIGQVVRCIDDERCTDYELRVNRLVVATSLTAGQRYKIIDIVVLPGCELLHLENVSGCWSTSRFEPLTKLELITCQ